MLALLATTVGVFVATSGDPDHDGEETPRLSGEAGVLVALLEKKDRRTYHARYTGTSPDAGGVVLETWQQPPLVRQDSQVTVEGKVARTTSLVLDGGRRVRCTKLDERPWECQRDPSTTPADPLAAIRSRLGEGEVTSRTTSVKGRTVRCFRFTTAGQANELCVIPDQGIPVTVRAGGSELTLAALEAEVDDSVFDPPAAVTGS